MVNCVWYNRNGYSYYGVRALSTTTELGTARPEVLVEAAYVEAIDRIYRMEGLDEDVGIIAEAWCNLDDHSRSKTDEPFFVSDLSWSGPIANARRLDVRAVRIVRRRRDVVLRHEALEHLRLRRPQTQTVQSQEHGRRENSTRGLPGHLQYLLIPYP